MSNNDYLENRTFDEIEIGQSASLSKTLTENDVALFAALLATTAAVAEAQTAGDRTVDRVTDRVADRPVRDIPRPDRVETLRLKCELDAVGDQRGVSCRWSESSRDSVRGYQLYRIVNGSARQLVATVPAGHRLHAFDAEVRPGDHIVYGVVARNRAGRVIGIGGPVRIAIPG